MSIRRAASPRSLGQRAALVLALPPGRWTVVGAVPGQVARASTGHRAGTIVECPFAPSWAIRVGPDRGAPCSTCLPVCLRSRLPPAACVRRSLRARIISPGRPRFTPLRSGIRTSTRCSLKAIRSAACRILEVVRALRQSDQAPVRGSADDRPDTAEQRERRGIATSMSGTRALEHAFVLDEQHRRRLLGSFSKCRHRTRGAKTGDLSQLRRSLRVRLSDFGHANFSSVNRRDGRLCRRGWPGSSDRLNTALLIGARTPSSSPMSRRQRPARRGGRREASDDSPTSFG